MLLELPAVLLFFGLLCGNIADRAQEDPYRWFRIGLLLGPFGFFLLLFKLR